MCGRYTQTTSLKELKERFGFSQPSFELRPRYNIAPTQEAPVIINQDGRQLRMFKWGLIPYWSKDSAMGNKMINARAETVAEKASFKRPFQRSRCLVLADGFYEWRKEPGGKTPIRIVLKSREPFALAGLWDTWQAPDKKLVDSFTIITTQANDVMRPIHERMPVILKKDDEGLWLDPKADGKKLTQLLIPCTDEILETYEVSKSVNSPANDAPACVATVEKQ